MGIIVGYVYIHIGLIEKTVETIIIHPTDPKSPDCIL